MSWQIVDGQIGQVTGFKQVLPLGAYIESYFPEQDLARMLEHIDAAAECACNLAYLRIGYDAATLKLVERAVSHGMKIGIEPNGPSDEECIEILGRENVAFILNKDDQEKSTPEACKERYDKLKAIDPTVPVYSTGYKTVPDEEAPNPIASRSWSDIDAQQAYITGQTPTLLPTLVHLYDKQEQINSILWANPQCYEGYAKKPPTADEIKQMGFVALAKTKGLLWYSFYYWDRNNQKRLWDILDNPEWLEAVKFVNKTAREHEDLILSTEAVQTQIDGGYRFKWESGVDSLTVEVGKRSVTHTETFVNVS